MGRRRTLPLVVVLFLNLVDSAEVLNDDAQQISETNNNHDQQQPPNIVVMLADNLGYEDVSWFAASKHNRTPHLDRLGASGLTFTNWQSAAHLCSASRAALLTGLYPARTGIYPGVFHPDAANGLPTSSKTLAKYLQEEGYATSVVGKWHLGHRQAYLPTQHGFDEWLGVPFHMSGGSLINHTCAYDTHHLQWLPLYKNEQIVQQPVRTDQLAKRYAEAASNFIHRNAATAAEAKNHRRPFFLYMAFSHVHQLCASANAPEQSTCQWAAAEATAGAQPTFEDALAEMDWIAGQVLDALESAGVTNNTLVVFTSDNGPWLAEQACAGLKGPFDGQWLRDNTPLDCTACPHDYVSNPTSDRPRRCTLKTSDEHSAAAMNEDNNHGSNNILSTDGVHCGEDTGLGSVWEANLRLPTLMRWPGMIAEGTSTEALLSSLDLVPTVLSIIGKQTNKNVAASLDGVNISPVLFGKEEQYDSENRALFFWRDGFLLNHSPLGPPYGRFDVVAVKLGRIKAWFWTKSAHYNPDVEQYHDPPLLFDTIADPGESSPISYDKNDRNNYYVRLVQRIYELVAEHKAEMGNIYPLTLERDPRYIPCVDPTTGCRTPDEGDAVIPGAQAVIS